MKSYKKYIKKVEIKKHIRPPDHDRNYYIIKLFLSNDTIYRTVYSQGLALKEPPNVHDVINCILSDAQNYNDYPNIDDFVDCFGIINTFSKTLKVFNLCKKAAKALEAVELNKDEIDKFLI